MTQQLEEHIENIRLALELKRMEVATLEEFLKMKLKQLAKAKKKKPRRRVAGK